MMTSSTVIPAKAGISCRMGALHYLETPAFAGVTPDGSWAQ
ncbi:hypothetical protein ACVWZA_001549 [Sphingomonas sp. UYAg733]